jgi:4-diphosphocytidyl-2-C-methyl-D-erythritol kinase
MQMLIACLRDGSIGAASRLISNRLQSAAKRLNPWIDRIKRVFSDAACPAHAMTGSGSAYFGLLPSARRALRFARSISAQRLGDVYVAPTCR